MTGKVKLDIDGKIFELPTMEGPLGEKAIDISTLRQDSSYITMDNGLMNTGACTSAITFLDGEKGILEYRGFPIEQVAEKSTFLEVAWILFNGEKPTAEQLKSFEAKVSSYNSIPAGIEKIVDSFPANAHPMAVISASVVALSAYYPQYCDGDLDAAQKEEVYAQLIAQLPIIATRFYRKVKGQDAIKSLNNAGYSANFLHMMGLKEDAEVAKALDVLLVLHADHEQNCSTSTVRVVGSSKANIFASISAGIDALWGPLHGGANQEVLEMLEEIQKDGGDHKHALERAKDKNSGFKLMGFGHRVYKNFDPRARIIKKAADVVLKKLNVNDPLLGIAQGLEEEALKDPYFVERKLYPNVDFYSGIIYKSLGIPTNMFTVMFAIGRLPGWISQWKEMNETKGVKITRPRQIYIGKPRRDF